MYLMQIKNINGTVMQIGGKCTKRNTSKEIYLIQTTQATSNIHRYLGNPSLLRLWLDAVGAVSILCPIISKLRPLSISFCCFGENGRFYWEDPMFLLGRKSRQENKRRLAIGSCANLCRMVLWRKYLPEWLGKVGFCFCF